jgi:endonuclease G
MAKISPLLTRKLHVMREAAKRWSEREGKRPEGGLASLADTGIADSPIRQRQFAERNLLLRRASMLREAGLLPSRLERKIGSTLDFIENAPSEAARKAGNPVARIVSNCDPKVQSTGFATGFLVAPRLLLTNWHVFPDVTTARGAGANFHYERGEDGVTIGDTYEIDVDHFFLSSERLDFALVGLKATAVTGAKLAEVNPAMMTAATAKILIGQPVNIIQHPDGGPKTWVTENENRLIDISDDGFLQYTADTLGGSSGSPVFSKAWELVGLHHSGVPEVRKGKIIATDGSAWTEDMGDDRVHWIANEGSRISAIVRLLAETRMQDGKQPVLDALLEGTADPVAEVRELLQNAPSGMAPGASSQPGESRMLFTGPVTILVSSDGAAALGQSLDMLERSIRFDPDYSSRPGYRPDFLGDGLVVPAPAVVATRQDELARLEGRRTTLDYHHFSIAMNARRRLMMWSAANVDYDSRLRQVRGRANFGTDRWIFDPRIPPELQLGDRDFYEPARQSDRGHIVRRQDNAWGETPLQIEFANSDTFHWTNCTPQHSAFNRAAPPDRYDVEQGAWGGFEAFIQSELQHSDTRACILAGPVLAKDDPVVDLGRGAIAIPVRFWKVVVVRNSGGDGLEAHGFLLSQQDIVSRFGIEFAAGHFVKYRVPLREITKVAGIEFDPLILAGEVPATGTGSKAPGQSKRRRNRN